MDLRNTTGWVVLGFMALIGGTIVFLILTGRINLTKLLCEPNGDASMSRFQLLVFTFVVALCVLYATLAADTTGLPDIPASMLLLLGISATSYGVGKSLQTQRDTKMEEIKKDEEKGAGGGSRGDEKGDGAGGAMAPANAYQPGDRSTSKTEGGQS
jgi:hypothetical protein